MRLRERPKKKHDASRRVDVNNDEALLNAQIESAVQLRQVAEKLDRLSDAIIYLIDEMIELQKDLYERPAVGVTGANSSATL